MVSEPITATTPRPLRRPLLTQWWRDLTFLHWRTDPAVLEPFTPPGARPDVFDGSSWIGLIGFRMVGLGFEPLGRVSYFGSFLETNVRLCGSVGHSPHPLPERAPRAVRLRLQQRELPARTASRRAAGCG